MTAPRIRRCLLTLQPSGERVIGTIEGERFKNGIYQLFVRHAAGADWYPASDVEEQP